MPSLRKILGLLLAGWFSMVALPSEVTLLPDGTLRVTIAPGGPASMAVDFSTNLVNWIELGSAPVSHGVISISTTNASLPGAGFYRLADAEATFRVFGLVTPYVQTPPFPPVWCDDCEIPPEPWSAPPTPVGIWPGARITVQPTGEFTSSDDHGAFRFERRFLRSELPMEVIVSIPGFASWTNIIADASGALIVAKPTLAMADSAVGFAFDPARYFFHFNTGPWRGQDFVTTSGYGATLFQGAISMVAKGGPTPAMDRSGIDYSVPPSPDSEWIFFWGNEATGLRFSMYLPGSSELVNGSFNVESLPTSRAPWTLSSMALRFVQPTKLVEATAFISFDHDGPGRFAITGAKVAQGRYDYVRWGWLSILTLTFDNEPETNAWTLTHTYMDADGSSTNSFFTLETEDSQFGPLAGGFFSYQRPPRIAPPEAPLVLFLTVWEGSEPRWDFTLQFDGPDSGTYRANTGGIGMFTYRIDGMKANLRLRGETPRSMDLTLESYYTPGSGMLNYFSGSMSWEDEPSEVEGTFSCEFP